MDEERRSHSQTYKMKDLEDEYKAKSNSNSRRRTDAGILKF